MSQKEGTCAAYGTTVGNTAFRVLFTGVNTCHGPTRQQGSKKADTYYVRREASPGCRDREPQMDRVVQGNSAGSSRPTWV